MQEERRGFEPRKEINNASAARRNAKKGRYRIVIVRPDELQKYKAMNTRVEDKSGEELVSIISENVGRMLRRKMDAVTCIRMQAEAYAESWVDDEEDGNFTYVSGKFSRVAGQESPTLPENMQKNVGVYRSLRNLNPFPVQIAAPL